jgi:gliding motility-associated lipoprotein GldD
MSLAKLLLVKKKNPGVFRLFFPLFLISCCLFIIGCNSTYTSKKRGYYRVAFPEKKYRVFFKEGVPFTFEYPVYADVVKDSTYFDNDPTNPYWYNIDFPGFNGKIFLSYKAIGGKSLYKIKQSNGQYKDSFGLNVFDRMVADAFKLTNKNESVASSKKDSLMITPNGLTGISFRLGGNVATARQFFLSDSTKNFMRGALYFTATPNMDSIKPMQDFISSDIDHLINSFKWVPGKKLSYPATKMNLTKNY